MGYGEGVGRDENKEDLRFLMIFCNSSVHGI
jgi:hypothetical protein